MQPEKVEFLGGCSNPLSAPPAAGFWVESRPAGCFLAFYTVTSYGLYIRGTWNCFASHRSISSSLVYQRPNDPNQLEGIHFGGASTRFASVYQWESSGICWLVVTVRHAAYIRQRRRKVGLPAVTHSATGNQWDSVNPLRRLRTIIAIPWLVYLPLMGGLLHLVRHCKEGPGRAAAPPSPLLAVGPTNVTAHPSTASVPTSYYSMWHYIRLCTVKLITWLSEQVSCI